MAIVRIVQPPNVTADVYDKVNAEMGVADNPPAGLLFHCAGEVAASGRSSTLGSPRSMCAASRRSGWGPRSRRS